MCEGAEYCLGGSAVREFLEVPSDTPYGAGGEEQPDNRRSDDQPRAEEETYGFDLDFVEGYLHTQIVPYSPRSVIHPKMGSSEPVDGLWGPPIG